MWDFGAVGGGSCLAARAFGFVCDAQAVDGKIFLGRLWFSSLDRGGLCPPFTPSLAPSDPAASWVVLFGKIVKG